MRYGRVGVITQETFGSFVFLDLTVPRMRYRISLASPQRGQRVDKDVRLSLGRPAGKDPGLESRIGQLSDLAGLAKLHD